MTAQTAPIRPIEATSTILEAPITGEVFASMPQLGRSELIEGKVITMSPPKSRHALCEMRIGGLLFAFVREHHLGQVLIGEAGIYTRRNPDTVRGMDVAFISNERWAQQADPDGYLTIAPELIVEVLSPNDAWSEVQRKLREYFAIDTRLVWVADPEARLVYAYRTPTDLREFTAESTITAADVLPGFQASVAEFFA